MAELFVDASGKKPKCYWLDNTCPNGKWYYIKTGVETLFIAILLLQPVIGFLFWIFLGAKLSLVIPVTILSMVLHCVSYPHRGIGVTLKKSKKTQDILMENFPVYITVSKGLSSICFIVPEKRYMLFTTLRYGDSRLDSKSAGWYIIKNNKPFEITDEYFEEPIKDLKSKLDYRCDLGSIIGLKDSSASMERIVKSMRNVSPSVFGE